MDLPYYPRLTQLRGILEEHFLVFPFAQCQITARAAHKVAGLKEIAGYRDGYAHAWNYDPKRKLYIEVDHVDPKIYIVPKDRSSLIQDNTMTGRIRKISDEKVFEKHEGLLEIITEMASK